MVPGHHGKLSAKNLVLGIGLSYRLDVVIDSAVQAYPVRKSHNCIDVGIYVVSKDMDVGQG